MACKGHINSYGYTPLDHVAEYMSKECACSIELYTKELLENIMFTALCDYLDSCDKPSVFMNELYTSAGIDSWNVVLLSSTFGFFLF